MNKTKEIQECCPVFDPAPWDNKTHNWVDKPFIRDYLMQFFHMPLPSMMGKVIGRMWKKAQDAGQGKKAKKYYFYYTSCPKCAKKFGHNYIVAFAEV